MVMFHHEISYQTAEQRGAVQEQLLADLTSDAATLGGHRFRPRRTGNRSRLAPLAPAAAQDLSSVRKL